jgi:acetylornithine deacetylase/succinyl-diaminopimelate desuccinylase-like protein
MSRLILTLGILASTLSYAKPMAPAPLPAHVAKARQQVNWEEAGAEAVETLQQYLAVDTVNPPGNEARGVEFIGQVLDQESIEWESVELSEGRSSLIARLQGSREEPPLCLMHHIDVVDSEPERWENPPLSGALIDNEIWGRGALDMKGMGVLELMTFVWLKRLNLQLKRDVILLAVADEEVDNLGAKQLFSDEHWKTIGCSHLINEGGLGIKDAFFEGQTLQAISVAEKGVMWIRMYAEGGAGHGSVQQDDEAPGRLVEAMALIASKRAKPTIDPIVYSLLAEAGKHKGGVTGFIMGTKPLASLLVKPKLMDKAPTRALLTNTVHLTGTGGASAPNVVPSEVWAQYDCRLLPGVDPQEQLSKLQEWTADIEGIRFEILHENPASQSPIDDLLYRSLARYAVQGRPESVAVPALSVGFTDSLFARERGVHAYGYLPFTLTRDEAETMHGHNERVSVENVHQGLQILFSAVVDFAGYE